MDDLGNLFIADRNNYRIRKVDTSGIISTILGTGVAGFSPDGSVSDTSKMSLSNSVRIDKMGSLFFSDNARIRKINAAHIITTVAGTGIVGFSGDDSLATNAEIGGNVISIDTIGNLFIADVEANRIRKVDTGGTITTVAGGAGGTYGGDNGDPLLASLCAPQGVAVNKSGDIYIGDVCNNRVRLITTHPLGLIDKTNEEAGVNRLLV